MKILSEGIGYSRDVDRVIGCVCVTFLKSLCGLGRHCSL